LDRFEHAGNDLQTDEIIERMGEAFYDRVFAPAVQRAIERGEKYETFRDTIRAEWKPERGTRA
jgi:hypothetical protein